MPGGSFAGDGYGNLVISMGYGFSGGGKGILASLLQQCLGVNGVNAMTTSKIAIAATLASAIVLALAFPHGDAEAGGVHFTVSGQIIVAPAPPPVVITPLPPPPPTVVVQPTPVVYAQPAPPPAVVVKKQVVAPGPPPFHKKVGLGLKLDGAIHSMETKHHEGMGGAGLLLRMRLKPHFAMELAIDALGGKGYTGEPRFEIPAYVSFMWYPGRHWSVVQPYLLAGFGGAWARVGENPHADRPVYLGGLGGIGLELRLGKSLALFAEMRGFIRYRINDRPDDPEVPTAGTCKDNGQCTDWEGGGLFSVGLIAYF